MLTCPICKKSFKPNPPGRGGTTQRYCSRQCKKESWRAKWRRDPTLVAEKAIWAKAHPREARDPAFKWRYGDPKREIEAAWRKRRIPLTYVEYETLYVRQFGKCAICGVKRPMNGLNGLHPDHCHKTGVMRGLLCVRCNTALGSLGDSVEGVRCAQIYLEEARDDEAKS